MENRSNAFGQHTGGAAGASTVLQIREEWRLAREAHKDLQVAGMPRTNLLLVGSPGAVRLVMEMLWLVERSRLVTKFVVIFTQLPLKATPARSTPETFGPV